MDSLFGLWATPGNFQPKQHPGVFSGLPSVLFTRLMVFPPWREKVCLGCSVNTTSSGPSLFWFFGFVLVDAAPQCPCGVPEISPRSAFCHSSLETFCVNSQRPSFPTLSANPPRRRPSASLSFSLFFFFLSCAVGVAAGTVRSFYGLSSSRFPYS